MSGKGVRPDGLTIDWAELMRFKRTFTDPYPEKREAVLVRSGIETIHGVARFTGPTTIAVEDATLEGLRYIE